MKTLLLLAALLLAGVASSQQEPVKKKTYFVWLVRGQSKAPSEPETLKSMQAAHIANFEKQFKAGHLIGAGPVQDPSTRRRGIVIFRVADEKEIPGLFSEDPYIQNHIMEMEIGEWKLGPTSLKTELPDPNAIEENRIVVISAIGKKPIAPEEIKKVEAATKEFGKIGVGGWVGKPGTKAIFLMQGPERESLEKALAEVTKDLSETVHVEIFPLWMAKEVLPVRKADPSGQ